MKPNLASLDLSPETAVGFAHFEAVRLDAEQLLDVISSLLECDKLRAVRIHQLLEKARLWLDAGR